MNIQFSYKQVAERDKKFLEEYITKKIDRFKKLISENELELGRLEIKTEKFAKKEAYKVELFLSLPEHQFRASEDDHTIIEAFDLALDKIIIQLRKYKERLINS
ncbi:ribosome-associated translation inhibitor RaiA [Candidatus Parcubacteria bacterium]|nr:ribosome-associated translation inhibitor RaiA [Patescibacteria group bacterium]MBU4482128.1 ribosome-associated translation inhibitor RaiA [Patescibacteria group bacterium]MCG2686981.1 ribosome-associated translation inhibitor RaiA [Candidatus Parcubacteria bacterium]